MLSNQIKQAIALEERLASDAVKFREQAEQLSGGIQRERLLRRAECSSKAAEILAWLNSPGLRPPV
jgi:hypothetical protein